MTEFLPLRDPPQYIEPLPARVAYNLVASRYDRWHWQRFWRENETPIVLRLLGGLTASVRALDVGTGTGHYASILAELGHRVVGVDLSEGMLAIATKKLGRSAALVQADAADLPFGTRSFDVVIAARVLAHIRNIDPVLASFARILSLDGTLVLTDVAAEHDYHATRIPLGSKNIYVDTYKHATQDVIASASSRGLSLKRERHLTAKNIAWLPEEASYPAIDRSGSRPISNVLVFRKMKKSKRFVARGRGRMWPHR